MYLFQIPLLYNSVIKVSVSFVKFQNSLCYRQTACDENLRPHLYLPEYKRYFYLNAYKYYTYQVKQFVKVIDHCHIFTTHADK